MAHYLITGGAGFIGSHLAEVIVSKGDMVRILDNLSSGSAENLKGFLDQVELIEGDIRDIQCVRRAVQGVDYILHQAALRSIPKSILDPQEYHDVNATGTLNLLMAVKEAKGSPRLKKFVLASSSSVYGNVKEFPQREDREAVPISPYALSKRIGEEYCRLFSILYDIPSVSLRYFNIYGPRQNLDDDYAAVIPKFITCLLKGEAPPIYGDGEQSRDFTYIGNIVDANLSAAKNGLSSGEAINVACGNPITINTLAKVLGNVTSHHISPRYLPPREGDVRKSHADITRLKTLLGLSPRISFEEGLKLTVDWFRRKYAS